MHVFDEGGEGTLPGQCFHNFAEIPRWKRLADLTLIWLALPLLLPMFLFIALAIWLVSGGPVFFRQERVGHAGKRFLCFKFRSMRVGDHSDVHQDHSVRLMNSDLPLVKMDSVGDPRIIPLGGLLRSSGLDELPQIINVIRGEMSLVGPRPCLPYEYEKFLVWQKERFCALPGLTGLWQVSGKNKTTFDEMIRLDIKYAQNQTLGRDLGIIARTVPVLVEQALETRKCRRSALRQAQLKTIILPTASSVSRGAAKTNHVTPALNSRR